MAKKKTRKKKNTSKNSSSSQTRIVEKNDIVPEEEQEEVNETEIENDDSVDEDYLDNHTDTELKTDTTSVSVIATQDLKELIDEDLGITPKKTEKRKRHTLLNIVLILLMILSIVSFGFVLLDKASSISSIITSLFITVFTILFVVISITYNRQKKGMIFFSSLLLYAYFLFGINNHFSIVQSPIAMIPDFQGKSLATVVKWASKNHVTIHQQYEYSDMIEEYQIISQDVSYHTALKDIKEVTVSVSEGPNPSKEIMLPNMIGWDDERVLTYIRENHLSNVLVDFTISDQAKDTVIEQSTNGSFKRDEGLHLVFSYGEELGFDEVTLIDFTNKSKFEVEFYLKQHQLRYDFEEEFSSKIKKGFAMAQSIKAGDVVKVDDERVIVTISKGPKIKVPELTKMSISDITEWAIQKKIKLNFDESYDDSIKENQIINANYSKGDIIEQGTVVKVTLSRGALKMPKFKSLSDFYAWANKYNIDYEEKHEFSDKVKSGEVISYSHKTGEAIKNKDTIIVTISDGEKKKVPDLVGLSKSEAISKLNKVDLNYNFIYKNSSKKKNTVLNQSIQAGSEISSGTTITITLSSGKEEANVEERQETNSSSNKNDNKVNNNTSNNSNHNQTNNNDNNQEEPTPTCTPCSFRASQITSTIQQYNSYESAASALRSYLQGQCPGLKVSINGVERDGYDPGDYIDGFKGGSTDSCSSISITLAK